MLNLPVAVVGATGLVGSTLLTIFKEQGVDASSLHLVASKQSAGNKLSYRDTDILIQDLENFDFSQTKIAFFCVGNDLAAKYAPAAAKAGNVVIDKSYYFRNNADVPLIIPEVNIDALVDYKKTNIIANPNCNTIPIAVGIKPIYDAVGITRINIATYQSVSGTGKDALQELTEQSRQILAHEPINPKIYPQQIAFNVIPHIDDILENGYTREEMKMVWELRKIFADETLAINPTAVRVPVFCGHAAAVHLETRDKITARHAEELLQHAKGVQLINGKFPYPTPAKDAAGNDNVFVGRVREDISCDNGLDLWIVADNLRKGAALNAIQIANQLIERHL
ncbi:MAG TPA: aspartate-semialdehyde dehydrogenase [Gammaproteobacteria bacterium]|nr:aspartate-semialdehyde dehydrogenase [Gammaproteobacteria bacterium]